MVADDATRVLGPHLLLAPLADGGMGAVFLAADVARGAGPRELCLVKTLKTGLASVSDYRPRFIDESRVAVLLRHEHLCQVFGGGESHGEFYLSMELIEGVTFKRLLSLLQARRERLTTPQAAALTIAMLRGLHAAHTAVSPDGRALGVVHRDVSPHNVMVDVHGHIKVIDFGLATSVLKETFTESAVVLGKSAYMAPEQARGEDVTPAVDQYAAAVVLYELLTDDRFYGDMQTRNIWSVVGSGTHVPRAWHLVPAAFEPVLKRALARRAADRFASCGAFADALVAIDPIAIDPRVAAGLGELVRALHPDELDTIAAARRQLRDIEAGMSSSSTLSSSSSSLPDVTERMRSASNRIAPSPNTMGQTESVSRSVATVVGGDIDTAATSATLISRPVPRAAGIGVKIAASIGVIALVVIAAAAVVVARRPVPVPIAPLPPVVVAAPLPPVAPTPPVVTPPVTPTPPTPPTPTPPEAPVADRDPGGRAMKLLNRIKGLRGCNKACVMVLRSLTIANIRRDPKGANELLQDCKRQCAE